MTSLLTKSLPPSVRLPFGLDSNGELVSILDAENGLACGCTCPGCGDNLVARQGNNEWHFAHHNAVACKGGLESALHLAVKKIIEVEMALYLPACGVVRHPSEALDHSFDHSSHCFGVFEYITEQESEDRSFLLSHQNLHGYHQTNGGLVKFDEILVEKGEGDIRPDLIGIVGGAKLYIEVAVTHFVKQEKLQKVREKGIQTIELVIPYSKGEMDWDCLRQMVLTGRVGKNWLYHPQAESRAEESFFSKKNKISEDFMNQEARLATEAPKPPLHLIKFATDRFGDSLRLSFSQSSTILCIKNSHGHRKTGGDLQEVLDNIVRRFHGINEVDRFQFEFPGGEDAFLAIAASIIHEGVTLREITSADKIKLLQQVSSSPTVCQGAIPLPAKALVTLHYAEAQPSRHPELLMVDLDEASGVIKLWESLICNENLHGAMAMLALKKKRPWQKQYLKNCPLEIHARAGQLPTT